MDMAPSTSNHLKQTSVLAQLLPNDGHCLVRWKRRHLVLQQAAVPFGCWVFQQSPSSSSVFFGGIEMWGKKRLSLFVEKLPPSVEHGEQKKCTSPLYLLTKIVPFCHTGGQKNRQNPLFAEQKNGLVAFQRGKSRGASFPSTRYWGKEMPHYMTSFSPPTKNLPFQPGTLFPIAHMVAVSFISPPEELQARPYNHLSQYRGDSPMPSLVFLVVPLLQVVSFRG